VEQGIVTVGGPSVRLSRRSTAATACGRFAAERPAGRTYRSTAADAGAAARRSAANAGSVTLTAELTRLNTDLYIALFAYHFCKSIDANASYI